MVYVLVSYVCPLTGESDAWATWGVFPNDTLAERERQSLRAIMRRKGIRGTTLVSHKDARAWNAVDARTPCSLTAVTLA